MKLCPTTVLVAILAECSMTHGVGGSGPEQSPRFPPAKKKELPWLPVLGGQMKTTLFDGRWGCRREFMRSYQTECAQQGFPLIGCMLLAEPTPKELQDRCPRRNAQQLRAVTAPPSESVMP
jgi:hypothetical protein